MLQMDQLMQVFDSVADQSESCALEAGSVPRNDTSTAMRGAPGKRQTSGTNSPVVTCSVEIHVAREKLRLGATQSGVTAAQGVTSASAAPVVRIAPGAERLLAAASHRSFLVACPELVSRWRLVRDEPAYGLRECAPSSPLRRSAHDTRSLWRTWFARQSLLLALSLGRGDHPAADAHPVPQKSRSGDHRSGSRR